MQNRKIMRQSGFTLIEIAIVLVVIGLMLGGVLKGQSMIENAKVKALQREFGSVQTMVYAYQDKFKSLPGDDNAAVAHQTGAMQATAATAGNGIIETGTWVGAAAPVATNESSVFWQHVRLAGLATGTVTSGEAINAVGGKLGITSNLLHPTTPAGIGGQFTVCSSGISGKLARLLDYAMDDGLPNNGSMFASQEAAGPVVAATALLAAWTAASDNRTFTVCMAV